MAVALMVIVGGERSVPERPGNPDHQKLAKKHPAGKVRPAVDRQEAEPDELPVIPADPQKLPPEDPPPPPAAPNPVAAIAKALGHDADKSAFHRWLKRNLDDPNYEEVHWWPPREMVDDYHDETKRLEQFIAVNGKKVADAEAAIDDCKRRGIQRPPWPNNPGSVMPLEPGNLRGRAKQEWELWERWWKSERVIRDLKPEVEKAKQLLAEHLKSKPQRIAGMRVRARNQFGAWQLEDIFLELKEDGTCHFDEYVSRHGRTVMDTPGMTRYPKPILREMMDILKEQVKGN
jgi:hypothetical protein